MLARRLILQAFQLQFLFSICATALSRRASAVITSPSGSYAPVLTECPEGLVQENRGMARISQAEETYIKEKAQNSIPLWREYLNQVQLQEFDVEKFLSLSSQKGGIAAETLPNIGFALSGGGARALCFGGSILDAFDNRNERGKQAKIGGILQLANYATGISGGSWLLGSLATSDWPRPTVLNQTLWKLTEENDIWDWNIVKHYVSAYKVVKKKKKAGFPVSIVDAWGRIISRRFIDDPKSKDMKKGQGVLWSSIRETNSYKNRSSPFVIAMAVSRPGNKKFVTLESPQYEYSPEDMSVWHPLLNATMPIDYMGSQPQIYHDNSKESQTCTKGFDNAGFVMAISSNIFTEGNQPDAVQKYEGFFDLLDLVTDPEDFEGKVPNTFKGMGISNDTTQKKFPDGDRDTLLMADLGIIREGVPIYPLLLPSRTLDVIIAVDASGDGQYSRLEGGKAYPNGTSLYQTYSRTMIPGYSGYPMPKIPNAIDGTFEKLGYNKRPTIFGCKTNPRTPLILYLPNYKSFADTDIPSLQTTYNASLINNFFDNGFAIASQTGPSPDAEWPSCLACVLIDTQVKRNGGETTSQCERCFERYCAVE